MKRAWDLNGFEMLASQLSNGAVRGKGSVLMRCSVANPEALGVLAAELLVTAMLHKIMSQWSIITFTNGSSRFRAAFY